MPEISTFDVETLKNHPLSAVSEGGALLIQFDASRPGACVLAARAAQRVGIREVLLRAPQSAALQLALALPDVRVFGDAAPDMKPLAAVVDARGGNVDASSGLALALRIGDAKDAATLKATKKAGKVFVVGEGADSKTLAGVAKEVGAPFVLPGVDTFVALSDGTIEKFEERAEVGAKDEPRGAFLGEFGGDVLSGIAGGLLARGLSPDSAALWAASLYALATEAAARDAGEDSVGARDVVERLASALRFAKKTAEVKKSASGFGLLRG